MKKILFAALFVLFGAEGDSETVDRIVAVVNDSIITLSELNAAAGVKGVDGGAAAEDKSKVLDSLIEKMLIKQAAERLAIEVSEKEIDNAIEEVKKENRISHDALFLALAQRGLSYRQYRDQMREEIRQAKFMEMQFYSRIIIRDEDIDNYYRRNIEEFHGPPLYHIRVIFFGPGDERLRAAARDMEKGAAFSELMRDYSGSDVGFVKKGEIAPSLEKALEPLSPGDVSGPVATPEGTYIAQLLEKKEGAPLALEEVKAKITLKFRKKMMAEKYAFWLEEAKKFSHIEVRP